MQRYLIAYVVLLALFPALDFAWIGFLSRGLYQREIGPLLSADPKFAAAAAFYVLYAAGVLVFAVAPGLTGDWRRAALLAAFFGVVAYATYDLTNLATLKVFTLKLSLIDMAWGGFMTAIVATAARFAAARVG